MDSIPTWMSRSNGDARDIDFLVTEKGMSRDDALYPMLLAVDLHVTQLVDDTKGIHAMLPKSVCPSKEAFEGRRAGISCEHTIMETFVRLHAMDGAQRQQI